MRGFRRVVETLFVVAIFAGVAIWLYAFSPLDATEFDRTCPVEPCAVRDSEGLSVEPVGASSTGLIVYTGARVVPEAYAPVAERIAGAGYPVFIPALTINFAIFDQNAADAVVDAHPEIDRWVIAGHSLGGAMAARYAATNDAIDGLVLWAAYPEESLDLTDTGLVVGSVSATNDGLATPEQISASMARLPGTTKVTVIQGGNHAQFGFYGEQRGDKPASISAESQWDQVAAATVEILSLVAR
jgi:dienelactone hydrolase